MKKNLRLSRREHSQNITIILFWILFFVCAILNIFPIVWALMNSMKVGTEFFDAESTLTLPKSFNLTNYINVFKDFKYQDWGYLDMLGNSIWMLAVRVFVNVLSSTLLAYALAKFRFPGDKFLYAVVIFANTIPIIGAGPASFRLMSGLGMVNNPFLIWIAWAAGFDFAFLVLYGAFKGVSEAYSESARIDGANEFIVLFRIVLPQVIPVIVAIAITQSISVWNDYGTVMIYLRQYPNLAYGLYVFNDAANFVENSKPVFFAAAIITCLPVIILYACTQKLILTNMTTGGLKG